MTQFRFEEINKPTPLGVGCINKYIGKQDRKGNEIKENDIVKFFAFPIMPFYVNGLIVYNDKNLNIVFCMMDGNSH